MLHAVSPVCPAMAFGVSFAVSASRLTDLFWMPLVIEVLVLRALFRVLPSPRVGRRHRTRFAIRCASVLCTSALVERVKGLRDLAFCACFHAQIIPDFRLKQHVVQTISPPFAGCRALVGGLSFPHRLVVEPSAPLGLAAYMCGLAADCPRLYVRGFQQFTRFSSPPYGGAAQRLKAQPDRSHLQGLHVDRPAWWSGWHW